LNFEKFSVSEHSYPRGTGTSPGRDKLGSRDVLN